MADMPVLSSGRRAVFGFRQAVDRLDRAIDQAFGDPAYCAAVEACMWATVLDERCEASPGYADRRDSDSEGRVLLGLRWVRHRGVHGAIDVHEWTDRLDVRWLPRAKVTGDVYENPKLESVYDRWLEGQPVLDTVLAAYRFLVPPL